jgi:hypothetical protein
MDTLGTLDTPDTLGMHADKNGSRCSQTLGMRSLTRRSCVCCEGGAAARERNFQLVHD